MKVRNGFVSNSSSSSFICDISGETYSGYDASLSDFGLCQCDNGHTFGENYLVKDMYSKDIIVNEAKRRFINSYKWRNYSDYVSKCSDLSIEQEKILKTKAEALFEKISENDLETYTSEAEQEIRYSVPEECCPVCKMTHFKEKDLFYYLLKRDNISIESLKEEIRNKFSNYSEFKDFKKINCK